MNLISRWRALWNPGMYHGWGRSRRYFEGWYFKIVSADGRHALAVIPGISFSNDGSERHAFVQVMDGNACKSYYHRFEAAEFRASDRRFEIRVGENFFSAEKMRLALPDLTGEISFQGITPWPKTLGAPGIMGWYSFVPFMECFHGVVSLDHRLEGELMFNPPMLNPSTPQLLRFNNGKGYIEKDWGRSFPRAYVWMQSNHFQSADRASLMASVAHIPWLGSAFIGFIGGFWLENRLFKYATYTGAKHQLTIKNDQVEVIFKDRKTELRLLARQAPGASLVSPLTGEMTGKVQESLQAEIQVELWESGQRLFEGVGRHAGLEVAGELELLA